MSTILGAINDLVTGILSILAADPIEAATSSAFVDAILESDFVSKMYDVILPIGVGLVLLWFMIDLLEQTTQANFTVDNLFRSFIKLFLGIVLVNSLYTTTNVYSYQGIVTGSYADGIIPKIIDVGDALGVQLAESIGYVFMVI